MRRALVLLAALLCVGRAAAAEFDAPRRAADNGRLTFIEENDALVFSPQDRHYTQGFRASYLSGPLQALDVTAPAWPSFLFADGTEQVRRYEISVGQSLFTPKNTQLRVPDPRDRPYAGWLYAGASLLQETDRRSLESWELQVGVVGPSALGEQVQRGFHSLLEQTRPLGYRSQLRDEPGVLLSYDRKWRFSHALTSMLEVDAIPEVGATVGNVMTYGQAGMLVRIGHNLGVDYGPARIRPAQSGTTWFDPSRLQDSFGWYLFAGVQVRAVAHNIFLDGNTFARSRRVKKEPLVADASGGVSLFWASRVKLDVVMTQRTKEFVHQDGIDRYGGVVLSFGLP